MRRSAFTAWQTADSQTAGKGIRRVNVESISAPCQISLRAETAPTQLWCQKVKENTPQIQGLNGLLNCLL